MVTEGREVSAAAGAGLPRNAAAAVAVVLVTPRAPKLERRRGGRRKLRKPGGWG